MRDAARNRNAIGAVVVAVMLFVSACSGGDDEASPATVAPGTTTRFAPDATALPGSGSTTTDTTSIAAVATTGAETTALALTVPLTTPPPADTGVPGLDSADAFCAAWSRFGGSWQVVLAATAFGDPDQAARLEVIASTVTGDAYDAIFAVWPAELAGEQQTVADRYFGAFQRRSADAFAALDGAGATATDVEQLAIAWVDALATRNPSEPELAVELTDDLAALVDEAGAAFAAARVPLTSDPSMVITAATPLTDDYLATACPDQGSITGQDVVDG